VRDDGLRLPPADLLLAEAACPACGAVFAAFAWPTTATVGVADRAITAAVPERLHRCPECGEDLPHPP
jgi:predicted RNA-binding Zn-ribbon protein involved in translation (DUF1610 family)